MNNITNQVAFLRTSREFPNDLYQISVESNKAYVDVANAVNSRTIGLYPANVAAITGNSYFLRNQRQQSLRRVYTFTGADVTAGSIPLGFNLNTIAQFVQLSGVYTNGTSSFGLISGSNVAIAGQISFYITPNMIIFLTGAGAPTVQSGTIIIEWISQA